MPLVVMQPSGHSTISSGRSGPSSHLALAIFTLLIANPPFGIVALGFAIASRCSYQNDWEGARVKGKISMMISVTGIILTAVGGLIFVLIYYTKDS